jgi:hypothetical protein
MGIMNIATTNGVSQMKNIDADIRSSYCPDQASRGSAVNELQDVLCTRLPSLHRRANRLLCNTANAEDAVQRRSSLRLHAFGAERRYRLG